MSPNDINTAAMSKKLPPEHALTSTLNRLYSAYIFDLDGTIYLGDELLPGSQHVIHTLREHSIPVRFVSNNPTRDPAQYAHKLTRLGIPTSPEDIVTTVVTTTRWLLEHHPHAVVYPISELPLIQALCSAGIRVSENPAEIDIVIASYDRSLSYKKIQTAFDAIWFHKRARLIATNPDRFCPMPGGRGEPDTAAIVAAIEACTGAKCEVFLGKPDPFMLRTALAGLDSPIEQCIMVGDRLSTDIRMARNVGMPSALVLTGDSQLADLAHLPLPERPDFVLEHLDQLLPEGVQS